ncbi:MAG: stage V sporulation protein AD [Defluviitaleaceae bacterium]|nr:stage V sporulation protein AD [Defluviitaleaceae bacterium]
MKLGRSSYQFEHVYVETSATVVGEMEATGPLGHYFDVKGFDPYFGKKSWEQAEMRMTEQAIEKIFEKAGISDTDLDVAFGGDLVNQLVPTHYAMRMFDVPFVGVYSACATAIESLILASTFLENNMANRALTVTSSHTNMAEKQFRMPVEYGGPKGDTSQYTATGSGAGLLSRTPSTIKIEAATLGIIIDAMQKNPADMGSAMAPAASHTISRHLRELGRPADYYDLIVTGDLASIGSPILVDLLKQEGYDIKSRHKDCGNLLYDVHQPTFAGGSGAGCVSIVTLGYIVEMLRTKQLNKVLIVGTGALLNSAIVTQKETIPCIAHAVALSSHHVGGGH